MKNSRKTEIDKYDRRTIEKNFICFNLELTNSLELHRPPEKKYV